MSGDGGSGLVIPGNVGHLQDLTRNLVTLSSRKSVPAYQRCSAQCGDLHGIKRWPEPQKQGIPAIGTTGGPVLGLSNEGGSRRIITHLV